MKKVNERTKLVPKGIMKKLEQEVEEENSDEAIWEMSQSGLIILCMGFIFKLVVCVCVLTKKINNIAAKSIRPKNEPTPVIEDGDFFPNLELGVIA